MQLLFPLYIFSLALPTIKFMGGIKLYEIIGLFLITIAVFQWRIKHFPKNLFIFYVLLLLIIFFSWLFSSVNPVIYFNNDVSSPRLFHLSRLIQLALCFGIFLVFSNTKYNEWTYLSKYYVHTFNLFCLFGIFFYILFLVFNVKSSFICCDSRLTSPYFSEPGAFGTILVSSIYVARSIRMRFSYFLQMTCLILTFSTLAWITYLVII